MVNPTILTGDQHYLLSLSPWKLRGEAESALTHSCQGLTGHKRVTGTQKDGVLGDSEDFRNCVREQDGGQIWLFHDYISSFRVSERA